MDQQTNDLIKNEIENNEVCLFMKGTPDAPQCGFSMTVTNILKILEVNFKGINVLDNWVGFSISHTTKAGACEFVPEPYPGITR